MSSVANDAGGLAVAVIGMGRMGVRHLEAARNLGMRAVGVVDVSPKALEAAVAQHGMAADQCFTSVGVMLEAARPQAVVVATTAPTHASYVIDAAASGARYILCEKPMATSLADADRMIDACRTRGTVLAVNHQMQFMAQYTDVRALIGSPALGPLSSILVAGSNFGLAMNACHYFEMFRFITGRPIASMQAWLDGDLLPNPRGVEFEDRSGRLLARSQGGPSMYMDIAAGSGHGVNVVYICRYGQILVDELGGRMRVIARKQEHRELPTTRYGMPADVSERSIEPADVVGPTMRVWSAMLAGEAFPDHEVGRHALAALVAAHASHEAGGREVRLDDPALPRERTFKWA